MVVTVSSMLARNTSIIILFNYFCYFTAVSTSDLLIMPKDKKKYSQKYTKIWETDPDLKGKAISLHFSNL